MATLVTYVGHPGRGKDDIRRPAGMEPWKVGESRVFDDALASQFGGESGDDFATFFCSVYNANLTPPPYVSKPIKPPKDSAKDSAEKETA